jgi:signal transduction histidine kinase
MLWRMAGFFVFVVLGPLIFCAGALYLLGLLGQPAPELSTAAWAIAILMLVGLLFTFASGVRRLALPLTELISAAGRVEGGDYSVRVRPRGSRELRLLGRSFNDMAQRLEHTEEQRRNLIADLSHELRTPVSVVQGNLEALMDGVYPADEAHLGPVLEEVRLLSRLIDDLRTLSEAETGTLALHREPTDPAVLVGEVTTSFRTQADSRGIALQLNLADDLPLVDVDPVRIREVLVNLITNAFRHTPSGGRVTIGAALNPPHLVLTVADTGSGIRPEDLPHVFERFYKSVPEPPPDSGEVEVDAGGVGEDAPSFSAPGGRGLGLTIAKDLVEAHGGTLEVDSVLGEGTTLKVLLPIESE